MQIEVRHPSELGPGELGSWSALQASAPEFGHPLLGPEFARIIGGLRRDARVAIWREGARAVGFLGFHKTFSGVARPIGAPFSDYHALVSAPGLGDPAEGLRSAGLRGLRVSGLVDPHGVFPSGLEVVPVHRIDLTAGSDAYLAGLWAESRNRWRNFRRYSRRLENQLGPLRIEGPDLSSETFSRLLSWKRRQLTATGLHDFTASPWARELFQRLFERPDAGFGGLMLTLYAGERAVAAHFGLRRGAWFHPWIGAYDPELAGFSPGAVHQVMAAAAAERAGVGVYDLGPRADRAKAIFANSTAVVQAGVVAAAERMQAHPADGSGLIGRLRNRWDHVSAVEPTLGGKILGMASAAAAWRRRVDAWGRAA